MADWYVYQHDGDPLGPWSTEAVAAEILAGRLAPDVQVAAPGGPRWLRALDVPSLQRLLQPVSTRPARRDSGLRLMPQAFLADQGVASPVPRKPGPSQVLDTPPPGRRRNA